jgi:3-oxoacyl-(acyl-carrier-protein) synthase
VIVIDDDPPNWVRLSALNQKAHDRERTNEHAQRGPRRISPFFVPSTIVTVAGHISMRSTSGPNISIVTACTTGLHCIGEVGAYNMAMLM